MTGRSGTPGDRLAHRHEADYIDRTIATVRIHRDADNCWPQWANIFADEIEDLRAEREALVEIAKAARDFTESEAGRQPMLGDRWYALTDALARLDSGATEGDAA